MTKKKKLNKFNQSKLQKQFLSQNRKKGHLYDSGGNKKFVGRGIKKDIKLSKFDDKRDEYWTYMADQYLDSDKTEDKTVNKILNKKLGI